MNLKRTGFSILLLGMLLSILVLPAKASGGRIKTITTEDGKKLVGCELQFDEERYEVPEGVVTICEGAFGMCQHYLVLSLPRSVRVIGDNIFGKEGGRIIIRNEDE